MSLLNSVAGKVFRLGSSGPVVVEIQLRLRALGYQLKGSGYFGAATDTAVTSFQKRAGLVPDGRVGLITAGVLDRAPPADMLPDYLKKEIARPLWLEAALSLIGTKEFAGPSDNKVILNWADEVGGNVERAYTHDSIPWCKLFWELCLSRAGIKGNDSLWALDGAKWGVQLAGPAIGATMPMLRDGGGHIAFVVGRDQHGNVMCVGGNQSDAVNIKPFSQNRLYAKGGYRWPFEVGLPALIGFNSLPLVRSDGRVSVAEA